MIPIQPEHGAHEFYVRNILSVWHSASDQQVSDGREWYPSAHVTAKMLADGDVRTGAGVLAALSPQTSWWLNIELACDAFESGTATRHLSDACSKANRIMAGEDPADVLPMRRKTGHFYRCILDPSNADAVCVDRHAHDIAVGVAFGDWKRGMDAHGRYELIAGCYREAARQLGELPSVVQAVTWVAWRENLV